MADRSWRRHFEGWQIGAVVVATALICVWLAVPRPVVPTWVPAPEIDRLTEAREARLNAELAEAARRTPLSAAVRTIGERFRRYGLESSRDDQHGADYELDRMRQQISDVLLELGPEPIVQLRAVQGELFVRAAQEWAEHRDDSVPPPTELIELGGKFAAKALHSGWREAGELTVSKGTLAALFRMRWSRLTGLDRHPFAPSLTDELLIARMMLERPLRRANESEQDLVRRQFAFIAQVMHRQPNYPGTLARGVLLFRLKNYDAAVAAFSLHLETRPEGPWTLRAANYRAAALQALGWL